MARQKSTSPSVLYKNSSYSQHLMYGPRAHAEERQGASNTNIKTLTIKRHDLSRKKKPGEIRVFYGGGSYHPISLFGMK
jgi:hypothetical protein